jgi:hypothetical protein
LYQRVTGTPVAGFPAITIFPVIGENTTYLAIEDSAQATRKKRGKNNAISRALRHERASERLAAGVREIESMLRA